MLIGEIEKEYNVKERKRERRKREKDRTEMRREEDEEKNVIKYGCDSDSRRRIRDVVIKTLRLERQDNTEEELR